MDLKMIMDAISTLGFPIVATMGCAWFIMKNSNQNRQDSLAREERMFIQLEEFSKSLNNFNATLSSIDGRIEVLENSIIEKEEKKFGQEG